MAIDPWTYRSGAPPAAGSPPYRAHNKAQSGQGFASFLRSSFDQAMADSSQPQPSVKNQTSSGAPVLRGRVDLGARPVPAAATDTGHADAGTVASADQAAKTVSDQQSARRTAAFTAEEESVLRVVAALQSPGVKPSSRPHRQSADKGEGADSALETSAEEGSGSRPMEADLDTLAKTAKSQVGKRYVRGGDSPKSGFDCSGFTNWVYGEAGVDIARNSRAQFQEGTPVSRDNLQKGDLVFFGSKKRVHHVGMYLGDGQFIHSTSSGGTVRISSLDNPVWSRSFAGARRMVVHSAAKEGHRQG